MGAKAPDSNSVIFLRNINNDMKARFKAWCSLRGKSMTQVLTHFMEKVLEKEERKDSAQPESKVSKKSSISFGK